ncbi:hypothetical protein [Streptomyces roseolilacinus]|uniref:Uncharacterized protein n=1 Tax=Streptomyces roseolilacinus TaxID=66904 RepID=A0A918B4K5_9ACTN|nr:hypothetical protein [Streptomyces roseolilacinus]GGQ12811.1 hypothetical protein GCM10010249_34330 [Streptomyces roseolilacinus]
MGLFSRKPKAAPADDVLITGAELDHAARTLNAGDDGPADALVQRGGDDKSLRQLITMRILGASIDQQ